jgi:hypothetical protein
MKTHNLILPTLISVLVTGCAIFNNLGIEEEQFNIQNKVLFQKNIAVLNFEKSGADLPSGTGKNIADKLSESLFILGKVNTIERSIVNNAQVELKLPTTDVLNQDKIKELGKTTDADFLIFGKISDSPSYERFVENPKGKITVSMRIISVESLKIVGMATISLNYDDDMQNKLNLAIQYIAKKISLIE